MKGPTIMRMLATLAAVALVALGAVSAAGAAPNSATTTLDTAFPTTGTTINATSGRSSTISRPTVPCPATTCGSSKGGM